MIGKAKQNPKQVFNYSYFLVLKGYTCAILGVYYIRYRCSALALLDKLRTISVGFIEFTHSQNSYKNLRLLTEDLFVAKHCFIWVDDFEDISLL